MDSKAIKKTERGQSLTELALSFTMIMLILSGVVDLGRAFFVVIALRDAAQEGAVYASVYPTDYTGIRDRVRTSSSDPVDFSILTDDQITRTFTDGHACSGFDTDAPEKSFGVTVRVMYDFQFTMPLIITVARPWLQPDNTLELKVGATHTILFPMC